MVLGCMFVAFVVPRVNVSWLACVHAGFDVIRCAFDTTMILDNNIGPKGANMVERQLARLDIFASFYSTCCRHGTLLPYFHSRHKPIIITCACREGAGQHLL